MVEPFSLRKANGNDKNAYVWDLANILVWENIKKVAKGLMLTFAIRSTSYLFYGKKYK